MTSRLDNLMSALGKRTLAAAVALPPRLRPSDLQALPRQLIDAIQVDAGAASRAPEVDQVIGKLTRSLVAAGGLAATGPEPARGASDPSAEDTLRPPEGPAHLDPPRGPGAAPAEEPRPAATTSPHEQAAAVIEAAVRRMIVAARRGDARAAVVAARVGEHVRELMATVERALTIELTREAGERDGAPRDADASDPRKKDADREGGEENDAEVTAGRSQATDAPPAHDPKLRIATFGHESFDRGWFEHGSRDGHAAPQLDPRRAPAPGSYAAHGIAVPTLLGPIRFHGGDSATAGEAARSGALEAKLAQTTPSGTSALTLDRTGAQLAVDGAFGSLQWGPGGLRGYIPGLGRLDGGAPRPVERTPVDKTPVDKTPVDKSPVGKEPDDKKPGHDQTTRPPASADDKTPDDKTPDDKKPDDKKPGQDLATRPPASADDKKPDDKKPGQDLATRPAASADGTTPDDKTPDDKTPDDKKPGQDLATRPAASADRKTPGHPANKPVAPDDKTPGHAPGKRDAASGAHQGKHAGAARKKVDDEPVNKPADRGPADAAPRAASAIAGTRLTAPATHRPAHQGATASTPTQAPTPGAHTARQTGAAARAPATLAPPRSGPRTITAPPIPSQPAAHALPRSGDIVQPSFQISGQGRTPPTPRLPQALGNPGSAHDAKPAGPASPLLARASAQHPRPPGPASRSPQVATPRPAPRSPQVTPRPAPPRAPAPARAPAPSLPAAPPVHRGAPAPAPAARATQARAPARPSDRTTSARPVRETGSQVAQVKPVATRQHPSLAQPIAAVPPTPAGTTAAPRVPAPAPPAPHIPAVQAPPASSSAPRPGGMVPSTVRLDGDRSAARSGLAAESATQREVPEAASAQTRSQVAPLGPELRSQVPAVEAPARRASIAHGQQGTVSTHHGGLERSRQTSAQGQQQIAGQSLGAAQQRAEIAGAPPPGVIAASSPAAVAHVTSSARGEIAAVTAASPQRPKHEAAAIASAAAAATAHIAAQAQGEAPPPLATRHGVPARPLAAVDTAAATDAQATVAGHFAAARTLLARPPEAPQLHLPTAAPVEDAGPGRGIAGGAAGSSAGRGGGGATNRARAIAGIEAGVAAQMQSQAPGQLAHGHAALTGELHGHIDRAEQVNTQAVSDAALEASTGTQSAEATLTATTAAAQATAQTDAAACRAQGQVQVAAARTTMASQVAGAQATAQTETTAARSQRDAGVARSRAAFEADQARANAQYTGEHAAAQQQFAAQNQAAQTELAADQQRAHEEAQTANQAAHAKNQADIARERAASDQRRTQAQAHHEQQVNQANTQAQADQQRIQSDSDQQVRSTNDRMRSDVAREDQRGQQQVEQHLAEGERGYHAEIQSGEQRADAERQRAEAEAAQKRAEASAQKDKGGGGFFGKVINWVKDRVNDLLDLAKSILEAARKAVMAIMEAARKAAMAVLEAARKAAMAALNAAKQAIQGLISAAAAAVRGLIAAAASMIRGVIQALSTALQGLVRALTTALSALVEAFQTFVNAALDLLIAAVSLINADLGKRLAQATQGFRQAFNQACDHLQQGIAAAGRRLEQGIQAAADRASAAVTAVEHQLDAAVTAIEDRAHAAVDQAFAIAEAAVNQVFDTVEAGVNAAFDAAEATASAAFDVAEAAVEGYRAAFNAACDQAVELADKALTALGDLAAAFVDLLPDALIEGFIDFWNGPWRSMIIIGLATIAAVAITVATGGVGGPIAGMLLAGVIGGTLTGSAYLAGELVARQGAIDLAENGKGIYVPNFGYVPVGPDGKPDLAGVPADRREEVAGQLGPGGWAGSNFQTGPDGAFQIGPDGKPVGRPSNEIANEAVMEGIQGFGEGFISAALAAGGGSVGAQLGGLVGKRFASQLAQKVVTHVVSGAVEGAFDVASSGASTFWNTGFDALQAGKSPSEAFKAAAHDSLHAMSDPGAIATSLANIGLSGARARGLDDLLDSRLTGGIARKGADLVIDTTVETVSEAAGNFGYTLATTGDIHKAKAAGAASFDPTKIAMSAGMSSVGEVVNARAEKYAGRHGGAAHNGGSSSDDHGTSGGGEREDRGSNAGGSSGSTRTDGNSRSARTSDSNGNGGNNTQTSDGNGSGSSSTRTADRNGGSSTRTSDGNRSRTRTSDSNGNGTNNTRTSDGNGSDGNRSRTRTSDSNGNGSNNTRTSEGNGSGGSSSSTRTSTAGGTTHTTGAGTRQTTGGTTHTAGAATKRATDDTTHTPGDANTAATATGSGRRRPADAAGEVPRERTDAAQGAGGTARDAGGTAQDAGGAARAPGGTAAEVGAFRGNARPSDQPDLTHADLQRHIDDGTGPVLPDGVHRQGDGFVLPDGMPITVRAGDANTGSVASYRRTGDGYEVTVSRRASDEDIARAVAHEVAEIHTREQGVLAGPDALTSSGPLPGGAELSAHDHGRLAELRVLAGEVHDTNDLRARHELASLLDALGVRDGRPDADARLALIRPQLDPDTLAAVERMRRPQPLRLEPGDVDTMARIFDADPRFTADRKALDGKLADARNGNQGALGELEAIQRWLAEGATVRMLPTVENQAGRRNPDFLVDGRVVEVKTSSKDVGDRGIRRDVADVASQIKNSGPDAHGAAHLQLHGDAATASLDNIEQQVRRQFNQNRGRALDEVSVYRDGVLAGQWVRNPDGSVTRRFPPPDADAATPPSPPPVHALGDDATSEPGLPRDDIAGRRRRQAAEAAEAAVIDQRTGEPPAPDTEPGGPAPTGEPDRGGTASNLGEFRGDARQGPDLSELALRSMVGNQLRVIQPDGARYDAATHSFTLASGQRVRIEVGTPRDGSVASFEPHGDGFVVTVSRRARDQDVVRAVAHELAEIDAGRRVGDDVTLDNHADRPEELTTHLIGRHAEIRVLVDQLFQARLTGQSDHARRIAGDLRQLIDALGLGHNQPDAHARLQLLAQHDPDLLDRLRIIAPGMVPGPPPRPADRNAPNHRPDRLDHKVSQLTADQQAYYDRILASHPDPTSRKARKQAYKKARASRPLSPADIAAVHAARERLASLRLTPIDDGTNPNLVQMEISFDGTWNSRDDMLFDTNPALLNQMFHGLSDYQVGVGTSPVSRLWGGLTGAGIHDRINRAYDNLVQQINDIKRANPDAEIVLVTTGFSRGSTAARAFVNELNRRGVPDLTAPRDRRGNPTRHHAPPRIGAMVLFDTVGSVGIPGTNLNPWLDLSIPANAENVLHLTAGDEHRGPFPLSSALDRSRPDDDRIAEIELPGAHSDVGGSYPNAYTRIPLQLAQDYLARLGVHIDPVDPDDLVDPADPTLRIHDSGGSPSRARGVYPSHNPAPPPRRSGEDTDPE